MNQYEEFLEKIKKYFEYDEVVSEGAIINAYDLICILKEKIKELHCLFSSKTDLKELFQEFYNRKETSGLFFKKTRSVSLAKVDFVFQQNEQGHSELTVRLKDIDCEKIDYEDLCICKDNGTEELYFRERYGVDKEFVEHFQDLILANFQILEEFYNLFKLNNPDIKGIPSTYNCFEEVISDDFLRIEITYDTYGIFGYTIAIDKQVDFDNIFNREWLNHDSLRKYVSTHKEELLKRIAINILNLKPMTQKIITDYYAKTNNQEQQLKLK